LNIIKSCIWSSLDWKFVLICSFEYLWQYTGMWWWLQKSCMRLEMPGHFIGHKVLNSMWHWYLIIMFFTHFMSFVGNTHATLTLNISGQFHIFWMPLFEHFMCSGKMACSLQWLSNINACPVYWFWNLFKIVTKCNFLLALICLFARMSSVLWSGHMLHLKDFVELRV